MTANSSEPKSPPTPSDSAPAATMAARLRNFLIVLVAVILSVAVFLGFKTETNLGSLQALAESATPLEVALDNGKPSLMEFYADWCTSCQAMAKDMEDLRETYGDRVNFVMLNVDNTKWLPEMLTYRVDGIPHFVFLNATGEAVASTIGEQPKPVMAANLDALMADSALPYVQTRGRISEVDAPVAPSTSSDDPRSHGAQVKS